MKPVSSNESVTVGESDALSHDSAQAQGTSVACTILEEGARIMLLLGQRFGPVALLTSIYTHRGVRKHHSSTSQTPRSCCELGNGGHNNQVCRSKQRHLNDIHTRSHPTRHRNTANSTTATGRGPDKWTGYARVRHGKAANEATRADRTTTPYIAICVRSTVDPSVASMLIPATPTPTPVVLSAPVPTPLAAATEPPASTAGPPCSPAEAGPFA